MLEMKVILFNKMFPFFFSCKNFTPDQRRESIMSSGGVMGRMQMFGGGGAHKPDIAEASKSASLLIGFCH